MDFEQARLLDRRLRRLQEATERRQDQLHAVLKPLLRARIGDDDARGVAITEVEFRSSTVIVNYEHHWRGECTGSGSQTFTKATLDSPTAVADVEAERRELLRKAEDASRAARIAALHRELDSLAQKTSARPAASRSE